MSKPRMLLPLVAAALLAGCHVSDDKHTFISSVWIPMNIEVVDQITKKRIWYYEIPVYHKLTLDFTRPPEVKFIQTKPYPATEMTWELVHVENPTILDQGRLQLTGMPIRMIMTTRPAPELPPDQVEAQKALLAQEEAEAAAEAEAEAAAKAAEAGVSGEAPPADAAAAPQPAQTDGKTAVEAAPVPPVVVTIGGDGAITVGKHTVDEARLTSLMKAMAVEAPDRAVLVQPAADAPAGRADAVAELCRAAGAKNVTIEAAKPADAPANGNGQTPPAP